VLAGDEDLAAVGIETAFEAEHRVAGVGDDVVRPEFDGRVEVVFAPSLCSGGDDVREWMPSEMSGEDAESERTTLSAEAAATSLLA